MTEKAKWTVGVIATVALTTTVGIGVAALVISVGPLS